MLRVTRKSSLDSIPEELIQRLGSQAKPSESEGNKVWVRRGGGRQPGKALVEPSVTARASCCS